MGYVANNMDDDLFRLIGKEPTLGVSRWVNWVMMVLSGLFQLASGWFKTNYFTWLSLLTLLATGILTMTN